MESLERGLDGRRAVQHLPAPPAQAVRSHGAAGSGEGGPGRPRVGRARRAGRACAPGSAWWSRAFRRTFRSRGRSSWRDGSMTGNGARRMRRWIGSLGGGPGRRLDRMPGFGDGESRSSPRPAPVPTIAQKLAQYTPVRLTADLGALSERERRMIPLLIEAAQEMDTSSGSRCIPAAIPCWRAVGDSATRRVRPSSTTGRGTGSTATRRSCPASGPGRPARASTRAT